jgi:hypothetical protein
VVPLQAYSKRFTRRQLTSFKLAVAGNVLFVGLRSGRLTSCVDAFECLITSPFAREKNIGFYSLSRFYLRFVKTDADKLDLLVWLQARAAGFVMFDQSALEALLDESAQQYTDDIARLSGVFQSVRLHRPMERVLLALDQVMPRLTIEA